MKVTPPWTIVGLVAALLGPALPLAGADCNGNGADDTEDLAPSGFAFPPEPVRHAVGAEPRTTTAADLDGDGDVDVAVGCWGTWTGSRWAGAAVWVCQLDGVALRAARTYPTRSYLRSLVAVDLDPGSPIDLVVVSDGGITVLEGRGDAEFSEPRLVPVEPQPSSLAAGDVDGDGLADLALVTSVNRVAVLLGAGGGEFRADRDYEVREGLQEVVTADLDGDGDLDIAAACRGRFNGSRFFGSGVALLLNAGDGTFAAGSYLPLHDNAPGYVVASDLDLDGDVDLAAGDIYVGVLRNLGGGAFAAAQNHDFAWPLTDLAAADLDGDGLVDLVGSETEGFRVLRNRGAASFGSFEFFSGGRGGFLSVSTADVDGDGFVDLIGADVIAPLPARGGGGGEPPTVSLHINQSRAPVSVDRNENGIPDECDRGAFHRGDADGDGELRLSDPVRVLSFLFRGAPRPSCAEAADSDNDGRIALTDGIASLNHLFRGGPPPASPGPPGSACGLDPDPPGSPGDLGCERYEHCP